jgi:3-phenylpropionate/trans-cinnamate dioxygenase ferredoxin reductase subunit
VSAENCTVAIVGAGQAAAELAVQLRQNGQPGRIVVFGEEPLLPYQRPPLSKSFLTGRSSAADLCLRGSSLYAKLKIETLIGARVRSIDTQRRELQTDAQTLSYNYLVLTTGGRARRMSVPGADLENIFYLRTIDDALVIRPRLRPGNRIAIVGGGYIGLEVAAVARQAGMEVTVFEAASHVLARVMPPVMSEFYAAVHAAAGVEVVTGARIAGFEAQPGSNTVAAVTCEDGRSWSVDTVLIGVGLIPNTELAAAAGIFVDNGIVVDEFARTSAPHVLAAGDCAAHSALVAGSSFRVESVGNAIEQARVAAMTIRGKPRSYAAIPWFWSDQYDLKLQTIGLALGYDQIVLRGQLQNRSFAAFYLREGVILAADIINRPNEVPLARRLIAAGRPVNVRILADEALALQDLLQSNAPASVERQ